MFRIHTNDGKTISVDMADEEQAKALFLNLARASYQRSVSGVTLVGEHAARAVCPECGARCAGLLGIQYSVARPHDFHSIEVSVETVESTGRVRGGERLIVFADDVRMAIMAHAAQPSVRVALSKVGRRKFNPSTRGPNVDE